MSPKQLSQPKAFLSDLHKSQKWPVRRVNGRQKIVVSICWVNSPEIETRTFSTFQRAITREYDKTAVRFVGWSFCDSESVSKRYLRLRIDPSTRTSGNQGKSFVGRAKGVLSDKYQESTWFVGGNTQKKGKIWRSELAHALHEIGHALGLLHEQDRPDGAACQVGRKPREDGTPVGEYDANSIMNYCRFLGLPPVLTSSDIKGLHLLYGVTHPVKEPTPPSQPGPRPDRDPVTPTPQPGSSAKWLHSDTVLSQSQLQPFGEEKGRLLFVCRVRWKGGVHLGKLIYGNGCRIGYAGKEWVMENYSALQKGSFRFVTLADGAIPSSAIQGGYEASGQKQYVCSIAHGGGLHPGKIIDGDTACRVGYGGKEVKSYEYRVLVK